MEGEDENSNAEGSLTNASFWKKAAIVLAGPIINIIFALGVYFLLLTVMYNVQIASTSTLKFIGAFLESIKIMLTGGASMEDLAGPVGITAIVSKTSGIADFVYLLSIISLSLGITNLLPIPPLDGGKLLLYIIEKIKRKPLNEEISLKIQMIGFAFIIGLSMVVMYNDITRFF